MFLQLVTLYLVKWCSLPYEDSTWELNADIDQGKIEEFERVMEREPEPKRVVRAGTSLALSLFSLWSAEQVRREGHVLAVAQKPLTGIVLFETGATSRQRLAEIRDFQRI